MSLRFHEIAESNHTIQNPLSPEKLMLLGELCQLHPAMRQLDLACGKGELLCQWARTYEIVGTGVDISQVFVTAAEVRARELEVWSNVNFVVADAAMFPQPFHEFNIVSCLGAAWIGGGLVGTLNLMKPALRNGQGTLLVGEAFWRKTPTKAVYTALGFDDATLTTLGGLPERFDQAGTDLTEMLVASDDEWDRYYARQWNTVYDWLKNNPDDTDTDELREWIERHKRIYLECEREYLGWGVFVLKPAA